MEDKKIIMLKRKQFGLNKQMRILGRNPQVYDFRNTKDLQSLNFSDYSPDIWFIEGTNHDYPFLETSEKPAIVSAYFEHHFEYSCMGESSSDPQYVAFRSNMDNVDKIAEIIADKGGEKIAIGLAVNPRKTIEFAIEARTTGLEQKVRELMALPKEEQEKEIRNLLSSRIGGKA